MSGSILTSGLLREAGVEHGFTTRLGGVSVGPFASFNLSLKVGDDPRAVERNRRSFERETGLAWEAMVGLDQVHGVDVLVVDRPAGGLPPVEQRRFDASVTARDDVVLAVRTADCVPILLFCREPRAAAAVHAGWRGTLEGVAAATARQLERSFACKPKDLLAAVGPCIHARAFTVGPEVFGPFSERFGEPVASELDGGLHVDLPAANQRRLLEAGLAHDRVEVLDLCTFERDDLFFSHRRDRGSTGRQIAFIGLAP